MQAAFPIMKAQGRGNIVNLCSLNGVNAHMGTLEYNTAKEALRTLTRTGRSRMGALRHHRQRHLPRRQERHLPRRDGASTPSSCTPPTPPTRWATSATPSDDIAPVALFLASDDAHYLTGNTLFVDGGSHINGSSWAPELPSEPPAGR